MISLQTLHRGNARAAGRYYSDQKDDYYGADGLAAQWQGLGAERVGLTGTANAEQFLAAMQGDFGPDVQLSRSVRKDAKSRAGLDVTLSAPKSVSIQALVGRDATVLAAHDHAVTKALEFVERELIHGRQKQNGETRSENTGNAIIAKFRHETARPTEFDEADPQLHTHAIVMNATRRADGAWVAISNEAIYRSKKMIDLVYKSEMAAYLEKAGYALRYEKDNLELAHIDRVHIEHYSKRGMTIEAELAKVGQSRKSASHRLKQTIALATRNEKRPEITRDELQARWERDAKEMGLSLSKMRRGTVLERNQRHQNEIEEPGVGPRVRAGGIGKSGPPMGRQDISINWEKRHTDHESPAGPPPARGSSKSIPMGDGPAPASSAALRMEVAHECVSWAIRHIGEREAVTTQTEIMERAMNHAMGTAVSYWEIKNAVAAAVQSGHLIKGAAVYRSDLGDGDGDVLSREAWVDKMVRLGASREDAQRNVRRAIATGALTLAEPRYTTQAAREREKRIAQIEREGRGAVPAIRTKDEAAQALTGRGLTPGQLAAAALMLSSENRIVGVQGLAGVGKSYMLSHVKEVMEEAGYTVKSVAPYSSQVEQLRTLNMEAVTVASLLSSRQNRFTMDEKTVLVIDEAAVVPTRQMEKILQQAEQAGARVVMLGDKDQTKAIEAGRPMHQLQDSGMSTALMSDIQRQTNPVLKKAVEAAAPGRAGEALHILQTRLDG